MWIIDAKDEGGQTVTLKFDSFARVDLVVRCLTVCGFEVVTDFKPDVVIEARVLEVPCHVSEGRKIEINHE